MYYYSRAVLRNKCFFFNKDFIQIVTYHTTSYNKNQKWYDFLIHFIILEFIHGEYNRICVIILTLIGINLLFFFLNQQVVCIFVWISLISVTNSFLIFEANSVALASLKSLNLVYFWAIMIFFKNYKYNIVII